VIIVHFGISNQAAVFFDILLESISAWNLEMY
jgi:hypothetical protein